MRHRALVALTHTDADTELLRYARLLADCGLLREVRFLHVLSKSLDSRQTADIHQSLATEIQEHFGTPGNRLIASCHVEHGDRLDTLLEYTHQWRADIVLLGHRRNRSGQRSLARRMAMISPCSVWLVPEGAPLSLRRILAPVDFSEHAADSLTTALEIARATKAEDCTALHVAFDESFDRSAGHQADYVARQTRDFEQFLHDIDTSNASFDWILEQSAQPAQAILRISKDRESDLIVMGTRGRSRAASILLGSVTTQVVIGTEIPILVVKHFGALMGLFTVLRDSQFWNRNNPKAN